MGNFNILLGDRDIRKIFPQPPTVAYRRDRKPPQKLST